MANRYKPASARSKRGRTNIKNQYKLILASLEDGLERLMEDRAYFTQQAKAKNRRSRTNGQNGVRATNIQMTAQRAAIAMFKSDIRRAVSRGDFKSFL